MASPPRRRSWTRHAGNSPRCMHSVGENWRGKRLSSSLNLNQPRTAMHKACLPLTLLLFLSIASSMVCHADPLKPRLVVLTDIARTNVEPDDMESMIRLLVHADLFEIEGLVATTGWNNRGGQEHPDIIQDLINAYERDLPNLMKRSNQKGFLPDESPKK